MKVTVEVDCSPAEARAFLGLPDVAPLNEALVREMTSRAEANMNLLKPDELMKSWMAWGGQAQEQFRNLMTAAASGAMTGTSTGRDSKK
jgi:hypothetical protein